MAYSYGVRDSGLRLTTLLKCLPTGATLYDFYMFHRMPNNVNSLTISTGSKLAAHMRDIGELDWAEDEIHWAENQEENPVEVPPCNIGEVITDQERRVHMGMGIAGKSMKPAEVQQATQPSASAEEIKPSSASVFNLDNYPPPWPLVPFSAPTHKLQKRIPFHLLPQKLVVHDPWNLLFVDNENEEDHDSSDESDSGHASDDMEWTAKTDIIRTYKLHFSEQGKEKVDIERKARAELETKTKDTNEREGFMHFPDSTKSGPVPPAIMVVPPLRPPPPESVPEAHLYLSPAHRSGIGNHSVVYKAELELPRSMLVDDVLCRKCMMNKVAEQVEEKQRRGEYPYGGVRKEGKEAGSGSSVGESSQSAPTAGKVTFSDKHTSALTAEVTCGKGHKAEQKTKKDDNVKSDAANHVGNKRDKGGPEIYSIQPAQTTRTMTYEGPIVKIFPEVEWQNSDRGPYCSHLQQLARCKQGPPTAKVCVAAKLSKQYDEHLAQEAENYQSFPSHLFEHWSGYNVVPPLHDPVPVGAVVPQFFGHYVPEEDSDDEYLSPILLIENCGIPVDPKSLNKDDRQECASLLYRFHAAGWKHNSFAERNIVMQLGPLSVWPPFRGLNNTLSFRLIDFGRSLECDSRTRGPEEMDADRVFGLVYHKLPE
jgi:hypothetical protein